MDAARWREITRLYHEAANTPPRERAAFLQEACRDDEALRREVESLLAQSASSQQFVVERVMTAVAQLANASGSTLTGRRIGLYQIQTLLGVGAMGEVYRARDTRLGRDVALKILPRAMTADAGRLARFEREARMLASLNHPHIAVIYGIEESEGVRALVLELVDGQTLAEKLATSNGSGLPSAEALKIASQIAEALDAAHEKGIIHRDLKPANVKVTPDGTVKVLDFGLAKLDPVSTAEEESATKPTAMGECTEDGTLLGTAPYMSPEQARGKPVDKRADIWAFGCVLYEMLSGKMAFGGETLSDTIAAILNRDPGWDELPAATPLSIRRLLRRCLEKDAKRRLRDIGDVRAELDEGQTNSAPAESARSNPRWMTRRDALVALAGGAVGAASAGVLAIRGRHDDGTSRRLTRFAIPLPERELFTASLTNRVAISRDGSQLACCPVGPNENHLLVRSLGEIELKRPLEGPTGRIAPFFSPDGKWLGYLEVSTRMRKIGLSGGAPVSICDLETSTNASWADDDMIYVVPAIPGNIMRIPAAGGEFQEVVKIDFSKGERLHKFPRPLPGSQAIVFTAATPDAETFDDAYIAAFARGDRQRRILVEGGTAACYSPSGHLVYARDGNLLAVRFDRSRLQVSGQPFKVLEGVLMSRNTGVANFDISNTGDLVYVPGKAEGGVRNLFWVDRSGNAEKLPLPARSYLHPRISPDGRKLAIEIEGTNHDVFIYDFASGVLSNITADGISHWPVWSSDGRRIGYRAGGMGHFQLWQVPADRSQRAQRISAEGYSLSLESYSPDGRAAAYTVSAPGVPPRAYIAGLDGDVKPQPLNETKYAQGSPKFSPDGRWVAYCSNESGKAEVYVQAFPGLGPKVQVSNSGGNDPVWRRTGGELFYRNDDSMMTVPVSTSPTFSVGRPQELWRGHYTHGMSSSCGPPGLTASNYDVSPDGRHFLMVKDDDQDSAASAQMIVVQGWTGELR